MSYLINNQYAYHTEGNVSTIEEADLVFVTETHNNPDHERFFAEIIERFVNKNNAVALVEESEGAIGYENLQERSPIKAAALKAMPGWGWDHREREVWLLAHKSEIKKIYEAASFLTDRPGSYTQKCQAFGMLVAWHNKILPQERIDPKKYIDTLLGDPPNEFIELIRKIAQEVIAFKKQEFVTRTFPARQKNLEDSIQNATLAFPKRKIIVNLGSYHASTANNPFIHQVQPFLERIGSQFNYIVLNS